MRTRIGDYAYEVREFRVEGGIVAHWAFIIYKVGPVEELVTLGELSPSLENAERNARQLIELYIELDRMKRDERSGS